MKSTKTTRANDLPGLSRKSAAPLGSAFMENLGTNGRLSVDTTVVGTLAATELKAKPAMGLNPSSGMNGELAT